MLSRLATSRRYVLNGALKLLQGNQRTESTEGLRSLVKAWKAIERDIHQSRVQVACVGPYNAGKSTLLNALVGDDPEGPFGVGASRTTTETQGEPCRGIDFVDTAGLGDGLAEDLSQAVLQAVRQADLILVVHNASICKGNVAQLLTCLKALEATRKSRQKGLEDPGYIVVLTHSAELDQGALDELMVRLHGVAGAAISALLPVDTLLYFEHLNDPASELVCESGIPHLRLMVGALARSRLADALWTQALALWDREVECLEGIISTRQQRSERFSIPVRQTLMSKVPLSSYEGINVGAREEIRAGLRSLYQRIEQLERDPVTQAISCLWRSLDPTTDPDISDCLKGR